MNIKRSDLNESIKSIPLPDTMVDLPISSKGFPVPFFASMVNGEWDFRVVRPETTIRCIREKLCWVCGKSMGSKMAFVVGPMCVVTRTSAEPPSHHSCAVYAAIACPFLAMPRMKRNEVDLPEGHVPPSGIAIMRNPGVTAVLVTRKLKPFGDGHGGMLIEMGVPESVQWYARRGFATYTDVMDSIESGMSLLTDECNKEDGPAGQQEAYQELAHRLAETLRWIPRPTRAELEAARSITPPALGPTTQVAS